MSEPTSHLVVLVQRIVKECKFWCLQHKEVTDTRGRLPPDVPIGTWFHAQIMAMPPPAKPILISLTPSDQELAIVEDGLVKMDVVLHLSPNKGANYPTAGGDFVAVSSLIGDVYVREANTAVDDAEYRCRVKFSEPYAGCVWMFDRILRNTVRFDLDPSIAVRTKSINQDDGWRVCVLVHFNGSTGRVFCNGEGFLSLRLKQKKYPLELGPWLRCLIKNGRIVDYEHHTGLKWEPLPRNRNKFLILVYVWRDKGSKILPYANSTELGRVSDNRGLLSKNLSNWTKKRQLVVVEPLENGDTSGGNWVVVETRKFEDFSEDEETGSEHDDYSDDELPEMPMPVAKTCSSPLPELEPRVHYIGVVTRVTGENSYLWSKSGPIEGSRIPPHCLRSDIRQGTWVDFEVIQKRKYQICSMTPIADILPTMTTPGGLVQVDVTADFHVDHFIPAGNRRRLIGSTDELGFILDDSEEVAQCLPPDVQSARALVRVIKIRPEGNCAWSVIKAKVLAVEKSDKETIHGLPLSTKPESEPEPEPVASITMRTESQAISRSIQPAPGICESRRLLQRFMQNDQIRLYLINNEGELFADVCDYLAEVPDYAKQDPV